MDYNESLNFIHSLERFGSKPGLERVTALLRRLGDPQKGLKFLHVAGTNGKGSTSVFLSHILQAAGYKTGLYISPFVVDFRERMQVDGRFIEKQEFAALCTRVKHEYDRLPEDLKPTEFEFITALAFCYFKSSGCDITVLETGLGGRLDATNVIEKPLGSIITKIGLDHTEVLGDTIDKIAFEKCGIIKPGCPVFTSSTQPDSALKVIEKVSADRGCALNISDISKVHEVTPAVYGTQFAYNGEKYRLNMPGAYQVENALLAIKTINTLFPDISLQAIQNALDSAAFPARFEVISREPLIILDGAHNPAGVTVLKNSLEAMKVNEITAVIGMMADKNIEESLEIISPLIKHAVCVTVKSNKRSQTAENLRETVAKHCQSAIAADDLNSAIKAAVNSGGRPVVIFGSLYLASEVKALKTLF